MRSLNYLKARYLSQHLRPFSNLTIGEELLTKLAILNSTISISVHEDYNRTCISFWSRGLENIAASATKDMNELLENEAD